MFVVRGRCRKNRRLLNRSANEPVINNLDKPIEILDCLRMQNGLNRIAVMVTCLLGSIFVGCSQQHPVFPKNDVIDVNEEVHSRKVKDECMHGEPPSQPTVLLKVPPTVPHDATKSGHCVLDFLVNTEGRVENVKTVSCSEQLFLEPSVEAAYKFRYPPKYTNCEFTSYEVSGFRMAFEIRDQDGELIPE